MGSMRRMKYVSINKIVKMEYIQSYIKGEENGDEQYNIFRGARKL